MVTEISEQIKELEKKLEREQEKFAINRDESHNLSGITGREAFGAYVMEIYRQRATR